MVHVEAVQRQYEGRVVHVEAVMMVMHRGRTRTAWCMWRL